MDQDYLQAEKQIFENALGAIKQQRNYTDGCAGQPVGVLSSRQTLAEEAAKSVQYHAEAHSKSTAAYQFLTKHPEFDEFVRLIRSGSIQI